MKRYFLLRKNREAGPFSRLQLKAFGLLPNDLVWVDGESTSWQHPTEVKGLKTIAEAGILQQLPATTIYSATTATPLQNYFSTLEENQQESLGHERHVYTRTKRGNFSFVAFSNTIGFAILAAAAVVSIYVLMQMFKRFGLQQKVASEAVEIGPASLTDNAVDRAAFGLAPVPSNAALIASAKVQRIDSSDNEPLSEKKKPVLKSRPATEKKAVVAGQTTSADSIAVSETTLAVPEEKVEPQTDYTAILQLSANEYKVGLFGGISNLEITVANPSSKKIGRATLEVDFLKPNGNVIKTQLLTVEDIEAGSSKSIAVPSSNRGVKVRYRVTTAEGVK